jgi:hypothetical protein
MKERKEFGKSKYKVGSKRPSADFKIDHFNRSKMRIKTKKAVLVSQ